MKFFERALERLFPLRYGASEIARPSLKSKAAEIFVATPLIALQLVGLMAIIFKAFGFASILGVSYPILIGSLGLASPLVAALLFSIYWKLRDARYHNVGTFFAPRFNSVKNQLGRASVKLKEAGFAKDSEPYKLYLATEEAFTEAVITAAQINTEIVKFRKASKSTRRNPLPETESFADLPEESSLQALNFAKSLDVFSSFSEAFEKSCKLALTPIIKIPSIDNFVDTSNSLGEKFNDTLTRSDLDASARAEINAFLDGKVVLKKASAFKASSQDGDSQPNQLLRT